jgi:predicted SAM-dependent methyltransferase
LRGNPAPKLQVGCGPFSLDGWLNTDLLSGDIYLNAEKKLPFENDSFNFIFCEHFIEHLYGDNGLKFLKECHRILRIGGVIRITTPDLEKLIELYFDTNPFARREECLRVIYGQESKLSPCEFFNNYMHNWGHKFIYDRESIASMLTKIGFTNLTFCDNKRSNHEALINLERHFEDYARLNPAETLIIEAEKQQER